MSAIVEPPVTPVAAPAAAPAPVAPAKKDHLPSGVKVDHRHDATEFFEKHRAENNLPPTPGATPATAAPVVAPVVAPVAPAAGEPVVAPVTPVKSDDLGSQVSAGFLPESAKTKPPVVAPVAAPDGSAAAGENPEDKVVLGKEYSQPAHESFKQVKAITKQVRETLTQRERELTEVRAENERLKTGAVTVDRPEDVQMRTENAEMKKRLLILDIESNPDFRREFIAPRSAAEQEARNILEANGVTGVDIAAMLAKDPVAFRRDLSETAAKLKTGLDQADFAQAMRTAHTLRQRQGEAMSKSDELRTALNQRTVLQHRQAFEMTYAETLGAMPQTELTAPVGATPEVIQQVTGFNTALRGIRAEAERIALGTSDPKQIASASLKAAAYEFQVRHALPIMSKAIAYRDATIADLQGQLAALKARNPNNRGPASAPAATGGTDPSKMNHHDAAEYYANLGRTGA